MLDPTTMTPEQLARISAWLDEVHEIAQLSQAALADLVERELTERLDLTRRHHTILAEVQDRLRGSHPAGLPDPLVVLASAIEGVLTLWRTNRILDGEVWDACEALAEVWRQERKETYEPRPGQ